MRKWNRNISITIIILFIIHGVAGSFQIMGFISGGETWLAALSWIMCGLICIHAVIGIKLTVDTIKLEKKSGTSYPAENKLFWTRRITGFVIIILAIYHIYIFTSAGGQYFRLHDFGWLELTGSILLAAAVFIHLLTNIKPLIIAFGSKNAAKTAADLVFVAGIVILVFAAAFVIYFLRWNIVWIQGGGI